MAGTYLSRRSFLRRSLYAGGALVVGVGADGALRRLSQSATPDLRPSQWLSVDGAGRVTITAAHSEMGQGVRTALPMIVAEELGADWSQVTVVHAEPGPAFRQMRTSGSNSVAGSWRDLRRAGAAAREMLVASAASEWRVDPASCVAANHAVEHRPTGRRLTFGALVPHAIEMPLPPTPALKPASAFRLLGTRMRRVDGAQIVNGSARYGLDVRPRGVPVAVVARPPQHGGRVRSWSADRARALQGVRGVVEISTGVAVVADDTWTAIRGRDALLIEWDKPPNAGLTSAALRMAQLNAVDHGRAARREGVAVDLALARAARVMDATYVTPFQAHAAMEPLNCIADVRAGACEIWVGTQAPNQAQEQVARMLAIPIDQVRIHVTLLGSSFGRRLDIDYIVEAVELSRAAHVPVQVVWTREDDMRHDRYQPGQVNRLTAGLDASGTPVAWRHRVADYHLTMFGPYDPRYDPAASGDPWGGIDTPYNFPSLDVTLAALESPVPTGSWRSVTYPAAVFARECFLDEVAHAAGRDPLALRLALLPSPGAHHQGDTTRPNGDRLRRVLELAAAAAGWGASQRPRDSERRWGHGIACNSYQSETMVAQVAEVSVGRGGDIRVHRVVCAIDCGQVINRLGLEGQCESGVNWGVSAALNGAVTFSNGRTDQSNFHDFPVLRMKDAPAIEVHVVDSELGPFGAGEPPVPPVAPAIANAVFHATGTRLRELPLRLSSGGSPSRGRE